MEKGGADFKDIIGSFGYFKEALFDPPYSIEKKESGSPSPTPKSH